MITARVAGAGRADAVGPPHRRRLPRSLLRPPHHHSIADVSYFMAHEWLLYLIGRDRARAAGTALGSPPAPGPYRDGEKMSV